MKRLKEKGAAPAMIVLGTLCLAGGGTPEVRAADFQLKPNLALSEEFNDNIFESATGKRSDFVTRVQPGASLLYRAPSLNGDLTYGFDYRNYAKGSRGDEYIHNLVLHGSAALTENFFFVDVSDMLSRVSLDVARNSVSDSLFLNQTDQNIATVSPYLLWRCAEKTVLKAGYRFTDTRYLSSSGIDKQEQRVFADLNHELSARLSLNAGYSYSRFDTELVSYDEHDVSAGMRFEYADKSFLFGGIGNSWQAFSDSRHPSNLFWSAGLTSDFDFLLATLETKVQYAEDPLSSSTKQTSYSARLDKALRHGTLGFSSAYSEYQGTQNALQDRTSLSFTGVGRYELSPRLTAAVSAFGDRVRGQSSDGYPYHFNGTVAVSTGFNYDITATLSYTYVEYRLQLDSASGAKQVNRIAIGLSKVF